jgi:hypothetical protein
MQRKQVIVIAERAANYMRNHRVLLYNAALGFSIIILIATVSYAALRTSTYFETDSDAIIATQQFSGNIARHSVTLPGVHANLLIIPLLFIQGHLPYHYASFELVNIGLVLATMVGWAYLVIRVFGRKYEIPIILLVSSLAFTSVTYNVNIEYTTIRNIEYPIALWFILIINRLISEVRLSRRQLIETGIGSILFCIVLAGDNLFNYAAVAPILVILAWYSWKKGKLDRQIAIGGSVSIGTAIGAILLKSILVASGLLILDYQTLGPTKIVAFNAFWPSLSLALRELIELEGGLIFGQNLTLQNLSTFIDFILLVVSTIGLGLMLRVVLQKNLNRRAINNRNDFVFGTIGLSFFIVFFVYILSGLVNAGDSRYITFLPLISIIGLVWLVDRYYRSHRALLPIICVLLLLSMIVSYPHIRSTYRANAQISDSNLAALDNIIALLKDNNVHAVLTDYWYGPPVKFWSNNVIQFATLTGCNQPMAYSSQKSWYTPQEGKSAIINAGNWNCSSLQLADMYGKPTKTVTMSGISANSSVTISIYNYDVRRQLKPFSTAY